VDLPIAVRPRDQMPAVIDASEVVWTDFGYKAFDMDRKVELVAYDLGSQVETRLTDDPEFKTIYASSRDYLVYLDTIAGHPIDYRPLMLWNRQSGARSTLSEYTEAAEGVGLSSTHVSFAAYGVEAKDVYYYDLETGVTTRLQESGPGYQWSTSTDGDYLFFMTQVSSTQYHIDWYRYSTGEITRIGGDDGVTRMWPFVRGHLATWRDFQYSGGTFGDGGPWDIVLLDLDTGIQRRVTSESDGYFGHCVDGEWLVFGISGAEQYTYALYAMNLIRAGILDDTGHVIPE
jgi:Tol biopolymer transport system component